MRDLHLNARKWDGEVKDCPCEVVRRRVIQSISKAKPSIHRSDDLLISIDDTTREDNRPILHGFGVLQLPLVGNTPYLGDEGDSQFLIIPFRSNQSVNFAICQDSVADMCSNLNLILFPVTWYGRSPVNKPPLSPGLTTG